MSRRITLRNEDHEWLVNTVEGMIRKANQNAAVWLDHMPQLERIRDALYTAQPGFEELFPDEPTKAPDGTTTPKPRRGRPAGVAPPPVGVRPEKKPRARRGERLATLPQLCPTHPAYGAVLAPRTDCVGCWEAFKKKQGDRVYEKALDRFNTKRGRAEETAGT